MPPAELYGFAIVPLVVALVEIAKTTGIPTKFAPVASLVAGILAGFAVEAATPKFNWLHALVFGIAYGLSASGLYSGVQKFTEPAPADPTPPPTP